MHVTCPSMPIVSTEVCAFAQRKRMSRAKQLSLTLCAYSVSQKITAPSFGASLCWHMPSPEACPYKPLLWLSSTCPVQTLIWILKKIFLITDFLKFTSRTTLSAVGLIWYSFLTLHSFSMQTFLNAWKLLGGHGIHSVTSPLSKSIQILLGLKT